VKVARVTGSVAIWCLAAARATILPCDERRRCNRFRFDDGAYPIGSRSLMVVLAPLERAAPLHVAVLPSGALVVHPTADDETGDGLSAPARARVVAAFARSAGHGVLDLGTTELDAPLSPALAFLRELGRAFATRLRAVPDLEERRDDVQADCPPDERARLAGAAPPMAGGEYVDADWFAARWAELGRAFAEEIRAHRGPVAEWPRAPSLVARRRQGVPAPRREPRRRGASVRVPRDLRGPGRRGRQGAAPSARARSKTRRPAATGKRCSICSCRCSARSSRANG
jgi:hypothetical protein